MQWSRKVVSYQKKKVLIFYSLYVSVFKHVFVYRPKFGMQLPPWNKLREFLVFENTKYWVVKTVLSTKVCVCVNRHKPSFCFQNVPIFLRLSYNLKFLQRRAMCPSWQASPIYEAGGECTRELLVGIETPSCPATSVVSIAGMQLPQYQLTHQEQKKDTPEFKPKAFCHKCGDYNH